MLMWPGMKLSLTPLKVFPSKNPAAADSQVIRCKVGSQRFTPECINKDAPRCPPPRTPLLTIFNTYILIREEPLSFVFRLHGNNSVSVLLASSHVTLNMSLTFFLEVNIARYTYILHTWSPS